MRRQAPTYVLLREDARTNLTSIPKFSILVAIYFLIKKGGPYLVLTRLTRSRHRFTMETIHYILLAFLAYSIIKAIFFRDRSPIPETSGKVYKIANVAELRTILSSTTHVVVDFYADWCPPCRAIAPIFSKMADDYSAEGQLAFVKVNVDHVNDVAKQYNVTAMPTFVFFEKGVPKGVAVEGRNGPIERVRGADKPTLEAVVRTLASQVASSKE
ncbi:thioredoxin-like protein, partial [Astrocystis sublimbata]